MNSIFNIKKVKKKNIMLLLIIIILFIISFIILNIFIFKKTQIKIGFANTLTGTASTSTIKMRDVAVLAVEEINKKGGIKGHKIKLIIKDDKFDPDVALKVDKELIDEGVIAIIGHSFSSLCLKVMPLINEHDVIMISPTVKSVELSELNDNFLRLSIPLDKDTELLAHIALDNLILKKIAVVYDLINPDLSKPTFNYFKNSIEKNGGKITADIPINSKEEFSARNIVKQIIDSGSDGVYIITDAIHASLLCQHLRINDSKIKIIVHGWAFIDPSFIYEGGKAVEGVIGTNMIDVNLANKKYLEFEKKYTAIYDEKISGQGQITYEALQILFKGLSKTINPKKLKKTLLMQKDFDGIDGKISFDMYGDPIRPLHIVKIQNGKYVYEGKVGHKELIKNEK